MINEASEPFPCTVPVYYSCKQKARHWVSTLVHIFVTFLQDERDWRSKERMKKVSVALVLCMNLGVDPPDVVKVIA